MITITESDVYKVLKYNIWKTPIELRREIEKNMGQENNPRGIPISIVYAHLENLTKKGLAEKREKYKLNKELEMREGFYSYEYSLSSNMFKNV